MSDRLTRDEAWILSLIDARGGALVLDPDACPDGADPIAARALLTLCNRGLISCRPHENGSGYTLTRVLDQ